MLVSRIEEGVGIALCVGTVVALEVAERAFRALKFSGLVLVLMAGLP